MNDGFFNHKTCSRCCNSLEGKARKMSWFNEDTLCPICVNKESKLKEELRKAGKNPDNYEGCGFIPTIESNTSIYAKKLLDGEK